MPENSYPSDFENNDLYEYLCDYNHNEGFGFTKYPIKSNISAILTGHSKHSCVFSINNLDAVPLNLGILSEFNFLEVVTLVKPSAAQQNEIQKTIDVNKEILSAIRPDNIEKRGVEVDTMKKDISYILKELKSGVFFVNVSFCLKSEKSLQDLRMIFNDFEEIMYTKGVVLYCHSNSARAQYISLFPGNALYGEHWNKCYRKFSLMLTSKVMGL